MALAYQAGLDGLLDGDYASLLDGARIGLVCHPASRDRNGCHAADRLHERIGARLTCLMGPEHGYDGRAAAGESVATTTHPEWDIPIFSLYGDTEQSLRAMTDLVDVLVFDLQDLSVRCYTYVYTLQRLLEAAAKHKLKVVVTDRVTPLLSCVDGPMLDEAFRSIVAPIPVPLVYGMTPGETAQWLVQHQQLDVDLHVVPASGCTRETISPALWPQWTPPSPAIRSWDCALCFPITVFTEALPHIDCARATAQAFRLLYADWLDSAAFVAAMQARALPGMVFEVDPHGVQLRVISAADYRPAYTAVCMLYEMAQLHGTDQVWHQDVCRPDWFDRLMGTDRVRKHLLDGGKPEELAAEWANAQAAFKQQRAALLIY